MDSEDFESTNIYSLYGIVDTGQLGNTQWFMHMYGDLHENSH